MNCKQCHEHLMRYFDHNLKNEEWELLHSHLDSCQSCHDLFGELTVILGSLEAIPPVEPDPGLEKKILKRIQTLPALVKRGGDGLFKLFIGSLSVIVTLFLLVTTLTFNNISFFDMLIQGMNLIYSFSGVVLDFQIIYHFITGLFSKTLFSIFQQVQSVYTIAIFMTVFLTVKTVYGKLVAPKNAVPSKDDLQLQ